MNLDDLFREEGELPEPKSYSNIMIIDFSNIIYSSYHGSVRFDKTLKNDKERYQVWRFFLLNSILSLKNKFAPDEIVLAIDDRSWRKDAYKYYKAQRVLNREKQKDFNAKEFYTVVNQFVEEITETFPYKVIKVKNAEADDVIAVLVQHLKGKKITIVSRDKDFLQMLKSPNITLFDPISKEFKKTEDPYAYLLDHVIRGDATDGIPNILSDDNVFVDSSKRQKRITKNVLKEIYDLGIEEYVIKYNLIDNYERNKQLVELSKDTIPAEIWTDTVFEYNSQEPKSNFMNIAIFMQKNKMKTLAEKSGSFLI